MTVRGHESPSPASVGEGAETSRRAYRGYVPATAPQLVIHGDRTADHHAGADVCFVVANSLGATNFRGFGGDSPGDHTVARHMIPTIG